MAITIQHAPVSGVAQLARRGGQQQQAVREQAFQFQQDLIGLQANLQQKRDFQLNQYQQQRDVQVNQYQQQRDVRLNEFQQQRDFTLNEFQQQRDTTLNQFQQDLTNLQADITQRRDNLQNQFQQQRDLTLNEWRKQEVVQAQEYEIAQLEKEYQFRRSQARKDRKFREEMLELNFELGQEQQKFNLQLDYENYKKKRQFDFDQGLEAAQSEFIFNTQLNQQQIMGDLAEQQMKQQQKERETEAAIKAIQENAYLSPEEQARAITAYQTKQTAPMKSATNVGISTKALQLATEMGIEPQLAQDILTFKDNLPGDLQDFYIYALRNPDRQQEFMQAYEQKFNPITPNREEIIEQRMGETGASRQMAADDRLFEQWKGLDYAEKKLFEKQMEGLGEVYKRDITNQAKEAERQEFLKSAIQTENTAERNRLWKLAGINPSDVDIANRLTKEYDKAWSRYNSAYKQWVQEQFDINAPTKKQEDRESRLKTRFTTAAEDMSRIETQLQQLSKQFRGETEDLPQPRTEAEYDALPSGTSYLHPDGQVKVKP